MIHRIDTSTIHVTELFVGEIGLANARRKCCLHYYLGCLKKVTGCIVRLTKGDKSLLKDCHLIELQITDHQSIKHLSLQSTLEIPFDFHFDRSFRHSRVALFSFEMPCSEFVIISSKIESPVFLMKSLLSCIELLHELPTVAANKWIKSIWGTSLYFKRKFHNFCREVCVRWQHSY